MPEVHGNQTHGHTAKSPSPEYISWQRMKARCEYSKHEKYKNYGGRGIKVCERWRQSFADFLADLGPKPTAKHSIERIDTTRDYEPGNCRWATQKEQCNNRMNNVLLSCNGETKTLQQWAEKLGVDHSVINNRLKRGWSVENAVTQAARSWKRAN